MHLQGHRPLRIAALILGLIALASCSQLPTAPGTTSAQNVIITRAPDDDTPLQRSASLLSSLPIDGRKGGVVAVGKWKVVVPAGAFRGIGTITISVPDSTVDKCDLSISPASLNHFAQPVDLRFKCASLSEAGRRDMRWWNPATNNWVVIKSWPNEDDMTRCAPLQHFSNYASGKAGW